MESGNMSVSFGSWWVQLEGLEDEEDKRDSLSSAEERKRLVRGTAVVRTSFACWGE